MTLHQRPALDSEHARRTHYRANIPYVLNGTAELYYLYWREFFHATAEGAVPLRAPGEGSG